MVIKIKRAYDSAQKSDGLRVLVDRLWPRGLTKDRARIDLWLKDLAPSTELRKWFDHDPAKWKAFCERYFRELERNSTLVHELEDKVRKGTVTLVYGARDEQHNQAVVLQSYLERDLGLKH